VEVVVAEAQTTLSKVVVEVVEVFSILPDIL
jgi:hypothetical protein